MMIEDMKITKNLLSKNDELVKVTFKTLDATESVVVIDGVTTFDFDSLLYFLRDIFSGYCTFNVQSSTTVYGLWNFDHYTEVTIALPWIGVPFKICMLDETIPNWHYLFIFEFLEFLNSCKAELDNFQEAQK